jgi:hypothetical protein
MKLTIKKTLSKKSAENIINSRKLINSAGKYIVKVKNSAFTEDRKLIVNLNACTQKQLDVFNESTNENLQYEVNRCQLSFAGKMGFIPNNGEYVEIIVDLIPTHKGQSKDFRVVELNKLTVNNPVTIKSLIQSNTIDPITMLAKDIAENMGIDSEMPF